MKIISICFSGYKNLTNCCMQMRDFNVLTGINNIGKSNFLEVFLFLDTLLNGGEESKKDLYRGFIDNLDTLFRNLSSDDDIVKVEVELSENFDGDEYKYWYYVELKLVPLRIINDESTESTESIENYYGIIKETFRYKNQKHTGRPIIVFEREREEIKRIIGQKIKKIDALEPLLSLVNKVKDIKDSFNNEIQKGIAATFTLCKTPVFYSSPEFIRMGLKASKKDLMILSSRKRVVALKLDEEIVKILKSDNKQYFTEIVEDLLGITEFEPVELKNQLMFITVNCGRSGCMLDQLSDGTLAVLNLLVYLMTNKYPIIVVEELENSVHPKLLRKIINLIKYSFGDTQFLITTHSPVMLNMVKVEDIYIMTDHAGKVKIEQVIDKKQLVKKLSGPFASMEDIFFESEV